MFHGQRGYGGLVDVGLPRCCRPQGTGTVGHFSLAQDLTNLHTAAGRPPGPSRLTAQQQFCSWPVPQHGSIVSEHSGIQVAV